MALGLACVVGTGLFILLGTGVSGAADPKDTVATAKEIIRLTNEERQKAGLEPLTEDATLTDVAEKYAELMARKQQLGHGVDGTSSGDRLDKAGYRWGWCGENVDKGSPDAGAAVQGWMDSTGHRGNILKPKSKHIGVGVAYSSTGVPYYCQVFAQPQ
jgi:uncharacterized protein YkwD